MFWWLITICCLLLATSSLALDPCYSSFHDISTREILGSWVKGSFYDHQGVFAHERNMSEWWEHACPAQSRIWTCRQHDANETSGHGYEAYSQRFVPSNCALRSFDPLEFMDMLRNRQLAMIGDSITLQFFTMVVCSLHGTMTAQYHLTWKDVSYAFGPEVCRGVEHCHLSSSSVFYPDYNTTITIHFEYSSHSLLVYYQQLRLTSNDIVLMNRGLHLGNPFAMQKQVQNLFNEYLNIPESQQPMLIWRESSPQHFDTPNGFYNKSSLYFPCHAYYDVTKAYVEDFHNRVVDQMFTYYKHVPIMRVWNVSSIASDHHVSLQHRIDEPGGYDCTHFCENSGVYYHWREILYNILPLVIEHKAKSMRKSSISLID
eukprot:gene13947-15399_t